MTQPAVVIAGVSLSATLLGVVHGRKYKETDGRWLLATKRGLVIATFATESELDSWWQTFQTSQGREPKQLSIGKPPTRTPRTRTPRTRSYIRGAGLGRGRGWDYLKPWSKKYGMPEIDMS